MLQPTTKKNYKSQYVASQSSTWRLDAAVKQKGTLGNYTLLTTPLQATSSPIRWQFYSMLWGLPAFHCKSFCLTNPSKENITYSSWWFKPIWKNKQIKMAHLLNFHAENQKNRSNYYLYTLGPEFPVNVKRVPFIKNEYIIFPLLGGHWQHPIYNHKIFQFNTLSDRLFTTVAEKSIASAWAGPMLVPIEA